MTLSKKLEKYLADNKVKYEVEEHKKVYTALDCAETQHLEPKAVVKTLVIKLDSDYALVLIPADKNLDKNKLKKVVNAARKKSEPSAKSVVKVDFAKEPWMKKNMIGKVGATPPFGQLVKLPVYIDNVLTKVKKLVVNSGEYTESIVLSASQFLKLEEPVKGSFSQKK